MNRLKAWVARDPLRVGTFAVLWVVALVPIWWPRFLPLLDMPDHLAAIAIWHRYHDPSWGYSKFYDLNLLPVPYWGYFFPVHLLAYLMPIEFANKVYLSAYALALPVGTALLARRLGRSQWLALFAFPLVFNFNLAMGFVTFCGGLAILLYALYALDRFLDQPTRGVGAALCILTLALYFTHILPWLYFGAVALCWSFCHGWRPRRMAAAGGLMLPSVAMALWGFLAARGASAVKAGPVEVTARFDHTLEALQGIPTSLLAVPAGDRGYQILIGFGLLWVWLLLGARTDENASEARQHGSPYRLEIAVALAAAFVFFLPAHLYKPVDLWMIGGRFVSVAALFGALLPHGPIAGRRRLLLVALVALALYYPIQLGAAWRKFDRRAASVRRLLTRVPRGSSVLTLVYGDCGDPATDHQTLPYLQFHAYANFYAGGYDPWALSTGFPMVSKPGAGLPAPVWKHPDTFRFDLHGRYYDYILTRNEIWDYSVLGPNGGNDARIEGADGEWRLYRVLRQ